jgi:hypothetical protein
MLAIFLGVMSIAALPASFVPVAYAAIHLCEKLEGEDPSKLREILSLMVMVFCMMIVECCLVMVWMIGFHAITQME